MKIISGLIASNSLGRMIGAGLSRSIKKLSVGLGVDAAWTGVSGSSLEERVGAQLRGLDRAVGKMQDGIALSRAAEQDLRDIAETLGEMRSIAAACSETAMPAPERESAQSRTASLAERVDETVRAAKRRRARLFGEREVSPDYIMQRTENIVSSMSELSAAAGAFSPDFPAAALDMCDDVEADLPRAESLSVLTEQDAASAAQVLGGAIAAVDARRAALQEQIAQVREVAENLSMGALNLCAADTRIADAVAARSAVAGTKFRILSRPQTSLAGQANQRSGSIVRLAD